MKKFLAKVKHFLQKSTQSVKGFFQRVFRKIASYKLTTLVLMQLKDKWNFSFKNNKRAAIFKLSAYFILFGVLTALCWFIMYFVGTYLHIFIGYRIPLNAMIPVIGILTVFEGVSILIGLTRSLFFAKDNVVLITYPVKSNILFISKLIVYYIDALKKSFMMFVPILIGFGIIYGYGVGFYFLIILLDLFYMAVIVLICGLLAIPACYVLRFIDKFNFVKIFVALALAGAFIYVSIIVIGIIPSNINLMEEYDKFSRSMNNFLFNFSQTFTVLRSITRMFLGTNDGLSMSYASIYTLLGLAIMIGAIALLVVGNAYLSKPFYTKMIATSNISKKPVTKPRKNVRVWNWVSVLKYETLRILRNEKIIIASLVCIIVMPIVSILANKIYCSINTRSTGAYYIYVFNFIFVLIVLFSHNTSTSYIYSKDGPSWPVNKTMPINPKVSLPLRLIYNALISLAIIIPACIIFYNNYKDPMFSLPIMIITLFILSCFHILLSASYDYSHSKNKDKADIGSEIVTAHEMASLGFGFGITVAFLLIMILFHLTGTVGSNIRLLIISILLLGFELWFFLRKIRLTYQEN